MATQRKAKSKATKGKAQRMLSASGERIIMFPTERTSIPRAKIRAAVDAVIAARKQGGKTQS